MLTVQEISGISRGKTILLGSAIKAQTSSVWLLKKFGVNFYGWIEKNINFQEVAKSFIAHLWAMIK